MSSPDFTLSYCTPEDIDGMVEVYLQAFAKNDIAALTFTSCTPLAMSTWLHARFSKQLAKREMRSIKITHNASSTLAAFLRYQVPHTLTPDEIAQQERDKVFKDQERREGRDPSWPEGANLEICDEKFGQLGVNTEMFVVKGNMYVAQLLATSPKFQRKGLASMLLRHVLDQADREGRKTYIEATPEGHPVYAKLGFGDVALVEVDLKKWGGRTVGTNVCMVRKPIVVETRERYLAS